MNDTASKSVKDLIDEYGDAARVRWREVFDETRARGSNVEDAVAYADRAIRAEIERGVLVAERQRRIEARAKDVADFVLRRVTFDRHDIDAPFVEQLVSRTREYMRELYGYKNSGDAKGAEHE